MTPPARATKAPCRRCCRTVRRTCRAQRPASCHGDGGHHEVGAYLEHYQPPAAVAFKYQWYHGTLDRAESTAILRQHARSMVAESRINATDYDDKRVKAGEEQLSSGAFLVRFSAKTGDYVLTLLFENQPKNFIIQKYVRESPDHMCSKTNVTTVLSLSRFSAQMKCLYIDEGPYMPTLEHLIQHYSASPTACRSTCGTQCRRNRNRRCRCSPLFRSRRASNVALMNTVGLLSPPSSVSPMSTSPNASLIERSADILNFPA